MSSTEHRNHVSFTPVTQPPRALELRREVRAFLRDRLPPGSYQPGLGMHGGFDREFSRALGDRGWLGMTWPRRYGGHERSQLERFVVNEELLQAGAPVMAHWIADRQIGPSILHYGPESLRQRFLPAIARGDCAFSLGMSESEAGSDLASVRTHAHRADGGWSLSGTKIWTGGAHVNEYVVVLCRTAEPTEDRHEGLSQLIVDLRDPGVTVEPIPNLDGGHRFNRVTFDEVFVGDDLVLGAIGRGWEQITAELAFERAGPERFLSPVRLITGLADAAGADAHEDLGDLIARLTVLRELSASVAGAIDRGETPAVHAALVKHQGTEFEQDAVEVARRRWDVEPDPAAVGPVGELARTVAFAPGFTIQGGTNEVLRTVVARALREKGVVR